MQTRMNDKEKSRRTTSKTLTSTENIPKSFGGQIINGGSETGESKDGSPDGAFSGILPTLLLSGWRFANNSVDLVIPMSRENSNSSCCVDRCFEQNRSQSEHGKIQDSSQVSGKKIVVLLGEMSNIEGAQLRKYQSIFRFESTIILYDEVCESHKYSLESLNLSSISRKTPITKLPDFVNSPSSVRRTSCENSRIPAPTERNSTVDVHLPETDIESCSFRQPTKTQRPIVATPPKQTWWKNYPKGWSFASSGWMSVLAALFLLVPLTSTNGQQVLLHPPKPVQSNTTTAPAPVHGLRSPFVGLPVPRNGANILRSHVDKTNSLDQDIKEVLKHGNSTNFQQLAAKGNSNSDVTSKIEDKQSTDVFYHDPVAALPEEEIYLPPEIYDTGLYGLGSWNSSNNTFYEQEEDNIKERDQEDQNYRISTTEDPFFRFFQTQMIAEHYDTSHQNRTSEDQDTENMNATADSEKLLEFSFSNYYNKDDVNKVLQYNSIGDNNSGVKKYDTNGKRKSHNKQVDESLDNIKTPAFGHVFEDKTARSYKDRKNPDEFDGSFYKELNAVETRETDRFKQESQDDVYDFGWDSEIPDYAKDFPQNTDPENFVNDIPSHEVPQDYVNDNMKSLGPQDYYVNDVPHVMPSKLEDENYHQSPSAGLWGHEVLSAPQWSHYPKIYRGMKRDRFARKTKNVTQNKGGARIVASSHYELQYILGRKIIFLCVARGKPRPRITWYKDGVELYAHNYFQVHEWDIGRFKLKSKMEIDPATPMDAGYYKCEANNEQGVDQAGFRTKYRVQ